MAKQSRLNKMLHQQWIAAGCPETGIVYNGIQHVIFPELREWLVRNGPPTEMDRRLAKLQADQLESALASSERQKAKKAKAGR
jgi:hypothetical protein